MISIAALCSRVPSDLQAIETLSVEQSPGQGFALVRIDSDSFEALRRAPLEFDWSRMEVVDQTREEILETLTGETGLAYPDVFVIPGHPLHWHPDHRAGDLFGQLRSYIEFPLFRGDHIEEHAHDALKKLRARFSRTENPSYVAQRMGLEVNDSGNFRALGGDGSLPLESGSLAVPDGAEDILSAALEKAVEEFDFLIARWGTSADPKLIGDIVGFTTWCFWRCPLSIANFLLDVYEGGTGFSLHHILLREGVGRAVHRDQMLRRYFDIVDTKLVSDGGLYSAEFSALGRVLSGCSDAADLLPKDAADRILQETCDQFAIANELPRADAYKKKYRAALLMLAALLRHRRVRPSFLVPDRGMAANQLLTILTEAQERNRQFMVEEERASTRTRGTTRTRHLAAARRFDRNADILVELVDLIHMQGSDPNIIRKIEEMDDEE